MALNPGGYTSSTAGTAADSAKTWSVASSNDANGNQYLTNGQTGANLRYAFYDTIYTVWAIATATGNPSPSTIDYSVSGSAGTFPLTGWSSGPAGTAPAPTFTANGSSGTTKTPVSYSDALLTDAFTKSGVTRAPRVFADSLLTDALTRSGLTHAQVTFSDALLSDTLTRSGLTHAPKSFSDPLLTDGFLASPVTRAGRTFSDTLFSDSLSVSGITRASASFSDVLLSDTGAASPVTRAAQVFTDSLLSDSLTRTGYSRRLSFTDALFSDFAVFLPPRPAPQPEAVDDRDPFVVLNAEMQHLFALLSGNPMSTNSTTLAILDKLAASYRINELSLLANTVAELPTLIRGGDGVNSTIYGYGQDQPILTLLPAADALIAQSAPNVVLTGIYRGFMAALQTFVSKQSYPSLDAYLTAQNTPTPYQALVHPNAALIEWLFNNQNGTLLLSSGNVFAPQTLFGTATLTSAGAVSFTHLTAIPSANVVISSPGLSTQGYTAAKGVTANVTTAINGTLTVTITASGQSAAGAAVTNRTWTAVLDNLAAGATATFVPTVAGDRIYDVTGCAGAGTATAGAFSLNSVLERVVS